MNASSIYIDWITTEAFSAREANRCKQFAGPVRPLLPDPPLRNGEEKTLRKRGVRRITIASTAAKMEQNYILVRFFSFFSTAAVPNELVETMSLINSPHACARHAFTGQTMAVTVASWGWAIRGD